MAVLQKIRDKNILLVTIVAVALLLFVIQGIFSGSFLTGSNSQKAGEINGDELTIQDYNQLVQDYQNFFDITQNNNMENTEEVQNQIRDYAWNNYVINTLVESECEKLGIGVTEEEINAILQNGESQFLRLPMFMSQETGEYDASAIPMFVKQYQDAKDAGQQIPDEFEKIYSYIKFAKSQIKYEVLNRKYSSLMTKAMITNPVEAQLAYDQRTTGKDITLVSVPYTSIEDSKVSVSDAEITAKMKEDAAKYATLSGVRDAKVIDVFVTPSDEDKKAIENDFAAYYSELDSAKDTKAINAAVRQSASDIPYSNVLKSIKGFPTYVQSLLDGTDSLTLAVGQTSSPRFDQMSNKYYIAKLIGKETQVDSVLRREMLVNGSDAADKATRADSILNALKSGAKFADIAKTYNQPSDSVWITTAQYENSRIDEGDNMTYLNTLFNSGVGLHKLELQNGNVVIIDIMETKAPITKYNVAIIDKPFTFSDKTYSEAFNKFSSFISKNQTIGEIEKNAEKSGYSVQNLAVQSDGHTVANVRDTKDAVRWLFDDAEIGDVSQIYRCGSNDHFMVVSLAGISNGTISESAMKDRVKTELINSKKAELIMKDCSGIKDLASAQKVKGSVVDTLTNVIASTPTFVPSTTSSEPMVSAIAAKTAKGKFASAFKGSRGVYMLQVNDEKKNTEEKFDLKKESEQVVAQNVNMAMNMMRQSLFKKANVKDVRYKFNM
mgnify:CR=1 FL=1